MRREVVELIESVRALNVRVVPAQNGRRTIRVGGTRKEFPGRLYRVARALEAVDAAGAKSLDGIGDPSQDAARLRMALDGIFRWMRSVGMDISQPHAIVANALGAKENSSGKRFRPVPQYAHDGFKKSSKPKPLLKLQPGPGEKISIDSLRQKGYQAQMVVTAMGSAAARG
jgi:hypothetical protein